MSVKANWLKVKAVHFLPLQSSVKDNGFTWGCFTARIQLTVLLHFHTPLKIMISAKKGVNLDHMEYAGVKSNNSSN